MAPLAATKENFARLVEEIAEKQRLPKKTLASMMDVTPSYLSQVLSGARPVSEKLLTIFNNRVLDLLNEPLYLVSESQEEYITTMAYTITDRSMEPDYQPGDQIVFDKSAVKLPIEGKVYLVEYGGQMVLRRVSVRDDGRYRLQSADPAGGQYVKASDAVLHKVVSLIRKIE